MIPKVIHCCWFGRGPMDAVSLKCLESWKKYCPDFQIKIWNEDLFDVTQNAFVKEAYEERKWAFVSDYVRLYALYHEGGVYLDLDVELLQSLEPLLNYGGAVTSYQECTIPAAVMLSEKGNPWMEFLLSYYDDRHFRHEDGTLEMMENDKIITALCIKKLGFKMGDSKISYGNVVLLPSIYFGPYRKSKNKALPLDQQFKIDARKTYAVHHGNGSWDHRTQTRLGKIRGHVFGMIRILLPERLYIFLKWNVMKRGISV